MTRLQTAFVLGGLAVVVLALTVALTVQNRRLSDVENQLTDIRADIVTACGGVVANLDLTEWVQVCRTVQPEDLN